MKRFLLLFALAGLGFLSCQKDNLPSGGDYTLEDYDWGRLVSASAFGLIQNESGEPVTDALVSLGNKTTMTDSRGVFRIENARVTENLAQVKVEKEGFFTGSRTFRPGNEKNPYIRIILLKKEIAGSFDSQAGGKIQKGGQVAIDFPPGAIVDAGGQPFAGSVQVAVSYLDPSAPDFDQRMPGNLLAFSEGSGEARLASFGMVAVELTGAQGQKLQLANGKPATLTLSVPASLAAKAPATIPLWYFDESLGIWVEEGEASLENGRYAGQVGHFSFWNCDVPYPLIHMNGSIFLDSLGNPFPGANIRITVVATSVAGFGISDADGNFEGDIPSGEDLLLEVIDQCGQVIYTENIGPFTADVVLNPIIIPSASLTYAPVQVTGVLVGCDSLPVTNGYVEITAGQSTVILQVDPATGLFEGTVQACDSTGFTLVGVDENTLLQSEELTFPQDTVVNAGQIPTCAVELGEYIQFSMDGEDYLFTNYVSVSDTIPGAGFILYGQGNDQNERIALVTPDVGLGTFPALEFGFGFGNYAQDPENIAVTVTEYGPTAGDLVEGTFEGTYSDSFGGSHTVTGKFKAVRE